MNYSLITYEYIIMYSTKKGKCEESKQFTNIVLYLLTYTCTFILTFGKDDLAILE